MRRHGKASVGAFLTWSGALYLALQRAYHDAFQAHDGSLNPVGYADEVKRLDEWEKARKEEP